MLWLVSSMRGIEPIRNCRVSSSSRSVAPSRPSAPTSASIAATARSTFAGSTPARMTSGPGPRLGSNELNA